MKNKRLTYVLIPLVLLIWGLIFYKIFNKLDNNDDSKTNLGLSKVIKKDSLKDTFEIKADYRDPFLSGFAKPIVSQMDADNSMNNYNGFTKKNDPKPEIVIPELKYFGIIANPKNKRKIGLFRLNNKDVILKEGDVHEDFKIIRFFNDSVKTVYKKNKKKTFRKNTTAS